MQTTNGSAVKPKWQRARILRNDLYPQVVSRNIWIKVEKPFVVAASSPDGGLVPPSPSYEVPIIPVRSGARSILTAEYLELLPDFRFDDPPFQAWEEFLAAGDK
jgi:hypothetical protein